MGWTPGREEPWRGDWPTLVRPPPLSPLRLDQWGADQEDGSPQKQASARLSLSRPWGSSRRRGEGLPGLVSNLGWGLRAILGSQHFLSGQRNSPRAEVEFPETREEQKVLAGPIARLDPGAEAGGGDLRRLRDLEGVADALRTCWHQ